MNNPYDAPKSEVIAAGISPRSAWWKVYFFVITLLSVLGMGSILLSEGVGVIDYIEFLMLLIATAGLYGFVFRKKVFVSGFWWPFLALYILLDLFYDSLTGIDLREGIEDQEYYVSVLIGYALALPSYYGLFRFGDRRLHPWTSPSESQNTSTD